MYNKNDKRQLDFLTEYIPSSYPLCNTKEEAKKYLLFLNRTDWDNIAPIDLIDYEKLIYIAQTFKNDDDINNLIQIIFERITRNYIYKQKYLKCITDDLVDNFKQTIKPGGFFTESAYIDI